MIRIEARTILTERGGETFTLDVAIAAQARIVSLVGASGAGKTSILNIVAGLLRPEQGRVMVDGAVWLDTAKKINHRPEARAVGYVFQDGRLFPHCSVAANLDYGRRARGLPPDADEAARIRALLGLEPLLGRWPDSLSGGERQRVAIGRALMSRPRLLLLDEPMASLDPARKAEIAPYLARLVAETDLPILHVSHDPAEVESLGGVPVRVEAGRARFGGADAGDAQ